ncbi:type 1 glutamine amidotransferase [Chitinophaga sp.]|uniref:type 1 glutamine amidotransferase n=1 Tax=Chitinophaga sp. TaxID=1869181 RepID=UPI00261F53FC|nr:gamma-glutamyl-gamma-aminobutyrate hydrolase family protein [uncultured Chitinophaga sp.]
MRIRIFQHVPFEGPAAIAEWANGKGHELAFTRFYEDDPLPASADVDMLVVMGGPMSVNDTGQYPWLRNEMAFIADAVESGKPVLGVCLGSQLLAAALGAKVYPNAQPEIGWFPVQFTAEWAPATLTVCHWHGDTFDLPEGAELLAHSDITKHQAFRVGNNAVGLQFHLEMTPASLEGMIEACGHHLQGGDWVQNAEEMRDGIPYADEAKATLFRLLDTLAQNGVH